MALVINTNVASLNAQRQLMSSGNALDRATERLSSGARINSAKDDAAGLAISNRMLLRCAVLTKQSVMPTTVCL
jgi:flagellin